MKTNMQKQGFTLIELLVVIVIIGILATISVATFSGYFKKARDAERQTAISNAATILKTARAVDTITTFNQTATMGTTIAGTGKVGINEILLEEGGYSLPAPNPGVYYYDNGTDENDEFVIFTCEEDSSAVIKAGTSDAVSKLLATCTNGVVTLGAAPSDDAISLTP